MAENLDAERMCSTVCRLCLGKEENFAPIFDVVNLPAKMKYCVEVEASPSDGLTSVICLTCLENVERFFNFKKMCADSQLQLKKISKESENPMKVMIVPGSISSGEKANDSGVDWSTEETRKPQEVGDSVTSTSAEDGKSIPEKSGVQQTNNVYFQDHLGSKGAEPDGEGSEGSDVGVWDDTEHGETAAESTEHPASREENAAQGMMVKREVMNEEEDYIMDENGEFEETEEPPWDKSPSLDDIPAATEMEKDSSSNQVDTIETEQTDSSVPAEPEKIHVCKYCSQSFEKRHQLYGHLATHSKKTHHSKASTSRIRSTPQYNRPPAKTRAWLSAQQARMKFTCLDCNQIFPGVIPFTTHKGIHRQKDKKFHCSVCNHIYPRAVDLIFHEWTYHTGDRPFPCDKCPSAFARQTSWTYHVLAHIGNSNKSPSRNLRDVSSNQSSPKKVEAPKSEVVSRRTLAPRKAALEGRAAAQMGAVVASVGSFPFKCRTCGKGILNEETWEYHLVIHPDGGETRQNLSPKDLESLRAQLRQTIICESNTKLGCLQCGMEYLGLQGLADHKTQQHLSAGGYRCSVCYKGVENVQKFIRHEMSHTKVKIYVCETCGREMADRMSFVRHIIAHFNENQFEVPPGGNSNSHAKGGDAVEAMDVKENNFELMVEKLLTPIQESLKQELAPCLQCGQVFEGVQRLITHKDTHANSLAGSHSHPCWICAKAFESGNALVEHEWTHTDTKPYGCDKCEQKFSAKDDLVTHLHIHFPAATANSSKAMPQPSALPYGKRQRTASSEPSSPAMPSMVPPSSQSPSEPALRPYACGQCKSIFSDADALEAHAVKTHGLVHPFKCKICGKGYRLLLRLMHHESSVHPQLMGHPCEYCDKSFSEASHLKLHCHLIHGDGPYMCDVCGKRFRMVGHLKIHRNMHNSGKDKRVKGSPYMGQATTSAVDELEYSEFDVFD